MTRSTNILVVLVGTILALGLLAGCVPWREPMPPAPTNAMSATLASRSAVATRVATATQPYPGPDARPTLPWPPPWDAPTPTLPIPTNQPPLVTPVPGQLPAITHDLVFVARGMILRWNRTSGQIELLGGTDRLGELSTPTPYPPAHALPEERYTLLGVAGESVYMSASGRIERFDLESRARVVLLSVPSDAQIALSPDARWLAYLSAEEPIEATPAPVGTRHYMVRVGYREVILQSLLEPAQPPVVLGTCSTVLAVPDFTAPCTGLGWLPDGRALAWNDGYGVWRAEVPAPAELAYANVMTGEYPQPGPWLRFLGAWSPSGRYVIVSEYGYNSKALAIIDLQTGRGAIVPGSIGVPMTLPSWPHQDLAWTRAGDLLMAGYREFADRPAELRLERWRVDGAAAEMLTELESVAFAVSGPAALDSPAELPDGRWAVALANASAEDYLTRGLFVVDPRNGAPQRVVGLPPLFHLNMPSNEGWDVLWTPDGQGALVMNRFRPRQGLFYAPIDGSAVYDVRLILGADACCFVWVAAR